MGQSEKAIDVHQIEKSFGKKRVLSGLSFTVQKGQIFALLGENGAGKTTMIRILTTLLRPDGGQARVGGCDVVRDPDQVRRKFSLTGQSAAVDPVLTGRENLILIARLRHLPQPHRLADQLLRQFALTDAADRPLASYSGGMRRRLDVAMGLIGRPPILFLDEPTTGLDPRSRLALWRVIQQLKAEGRTIFLTTQYLEEADRLADTIAFLNQGRIVASGSSEELKKRVVQKQLLLTFATADALDTAATILKNDRPQVSEAELKLTIRSDGSVHQVIDVLNALEQAFVPVKNFTQTEPSLDDVFMQLTKNNSQSEAMH
jgi:ABC-2 type transport system ATP-binding protein